MVSDSERENAPLAMVCSTCQGRGSVPQQFGFVDDCWRCSGTGYIQPRPFDYVWNGQRVSHYLNHGGEWHGCAATEGNHYTLRASNG